MGVPHMDELNAEFPTVKMYGPQAISAGVGPGWVGLLRVALKVLAEHHCQVVQIKEKFGGLRLYWDPPEDEHFAAYPEVTAAVAVAEKASFTTCEQCGQPGTLAGKHWLKVRCESCLKEDP